MVQFSTGEGERELDMRVISQAGSMDVPYESCAFRVEVHTKVGDPVTFDIYATAFGVKLPECMARYYSPEKAKEVMKMLRKQYAKLSALQTLLYGKADQCVTKSVNDFIDMFSFQFPEDTDL